MKKLLSLVMSVVIATMMLPSLVLTAYADEQGLCGDKVNWSYNSISSSLMIFGTGEMYNATPLPWESLKDSIRCVEIKDGVTNIAKNAFSQCNNLEEAIIADTVTVIDNMAFDSCVNLKKVKMSGKLKAINYSAFFNCRALKEVSLPTTLEYIGDEAFEYMGYAMDEQTSIAVPCSVKSIGSYAFNSIDKVYYSGTAKDIEGNRWGAKGVLFNDNVEGHLYTVANCLYPQYCSVCGKTNGGKTNHTYVKIKMQATLTDDGKFDRICLICGESDPTQIVKKVTSFKLSSSSYTYDGKTKTPSVIVKDSAGKLLKKNTDYTVYYSGGRKNVGRYVVEILLMDKYNGAKSLSFSIKPKGTSIKGLTSRSKGFTAKWTKQATQTNGYQIRYSTASSMKGARIETVALNKTVSRTVKSLKGKKKYYVQIRTYKNVSGIRYYSAWSGKKAVTTKK